MPHAHLPPEAILFDKDGTLMDFQASWAPWAHAAILRLCAADPDKTGPVAAALGFDMAAVQFLHDSPVVAGAPDDILRLLRPFFPQESDAALLAALETEEASFAPAPVSALHQTCGQLRAAGLKLAVVTNDFEASGRLHLQHMQIAGAFEAVVGYDSGYGAKPAPGPCLGAAALLGVRPEACVMVGDSLHDLDAGRAAGMRTVGVLTGVARAEDLRPHADVVLDTIATLPDWLAQTGA
nr:HAD family hydrolase [uncultured Celeribacter sp.]